jgi:beta,beta-carotene 9',10'-dioxygenase
VKIDTQTGSSWSWREPDTYPGEPVFVARPGAADEDDGVILSIVLDARLGTSYLLILNAHSFEEIARAGLPQPVLFGYHGAFFTGLNGGNS